MIYIVRHSETVLNSEGRWQGWSNSPLTSKGKDQADMLGVWLSDKKIDYIITSPSQRCIDTAFRIKSLINTTSTVLYAANLMEQSFGLLEGKTSEEAADMPYIQRRNNKTLHWGSAPQNGESYWDLERRCECFLWEYHKLLDSNKNILIVSHGRTIKILNELLKDVFFPNEEAQHRVMWNPTIPHTSVSAHNTNTGEYICHNLDL